MQYDFLIYEREPNGIAIVTLNRPERRNALSLQLMIELTDCLNVIGADHDIRAVILNAAGTAFSAGHDLSELTVGDLIEHRSLFDTCAALMTKINEIPQPVIAEVQGIATAAGCQLVATCDLAIAADTATFATPGVKIGLFCTTPSVPLARAIGRKRALQMLLTGQPINAATAVEWGLVNAAVPASELSQATRTLAGQIAAASPVTVSTGKHAFYKQVDLDQISAYSYATEVMTQNSLTEDAREGITAFLEKRAPTWTGR